MSWAGQVDRALNGWALPLVGDVSDESFGYCIAVHDEAVQHHREVYIRNRPFAE